jgi:predicted phage tail protein
VDAGSVASPLDQPNTKGTKKSFTDQGSNRNTAYLYRVVARNTVGYGAEFPEMTVTSMSGTFGVNLPALPAAPTNLTGTIASTTRVNLSWRDNASTENRFVVERAANGGPFTQIGIAPARTGTGNTVTFADTNAVAGATYQYRVTAVNLAGVSAPSNVLSLAMVAPTAPTGVAGTAVRSGNGETVTVRWTDTSSNESGFTVQWSSTAAFTAVAGSSNAAANATSLTTPRIGRQVWYFRVVATNPFGNPTSAVSPAVPAA